MVAGGGEHIGAQPAEGEEAYHDRGTSTTPCLPDVPWLVPFRPIAHVGEQKPTR